MNRSRRAIVCAVIAVTSVIGTMPADAASSSHLKEVGRVPLFETTSESQANGWLILNPRSRRGYQVFESSADQSTLIQSFDLDTLTPRRRAVFHGIPVVGGSAGIAGATVALNAGEVVHAVDEDRGRLYLALSDPLLGAPFNAISFNMLASDRRHLNRLVAIDEAAFDRGEAAFAASFAPPVSHHFLAGHHLMGLATDGDAALVLALAGVPNVVPAPGHWLARWNVGNLAFDAAAPEQRVAPPLTDGDSSAHLLTSCVGRPMGAWGGNYQWGLLATVESVWVACDDRLTSYAVEVPRAPDGSLGPFENAHLLPQGAADVLVDETAARLVIRAVSLSSSVTVFDTTTKLPSRPVQLPPSEPSPSAVGIDPTTGRVYVLADGAADAPLPGGLGWVDSRDALPSHVVARPDLAAPGVFRISVDHPTRRVFVRIGAPFTGTGPEAFYRVFEDKRT